ncbi:MAG: hypothetical protein CMA77_01510, partial [Euryarchaeota archaeon]|nr:hypothetical protein [Euryarchaeota archaeon]
MATGDGNMVEATSIALMIFGAVLGAAIGWLLASQKLAVRITKAETKMEAREEALAQSEELLRAQNKAMASDTAKEIHNRRIHLIVARPEAS